ncbi:MAG: (d)CMP kinase [Clostridiales bacterium]|nr:(d)CMP kinase [Clostridiales bacterium]
MEQKTMQIAIDGPSGSGKSTISKILARELEILYLDTGAMYRAAGLKALMKHIPTNDEEKLSEMISDTEIDIKYIDGNQHIFLDSVDVTGKIRTNEVSMAASDVSKCRSVRFKLVDMQRKIAGKNSVIMDGRDIGTYVLPNADYKFFLTAKAEERAKRRVAEYASKGMAADYEQILEDIKKRDLQDSTREFAPLKKAADAVEIDSTHLSISEVVASIKGVIK